MKLILFADKLPPLVGGMETHAHYFVKYFKNDYDLQIVSKINGSDALVDFDYRFIRQIDIEKFICEFREQKTVLFFNSGRWIEQLSTIRRLLPRAIIMYRTGGNEIIQAPMSNMPDYTERKNYWKNTINNTVDYLITNSKFTDNRLKQFGISEKILFRVVGGVDKAVINRAIASRSETRRIYGISSADKVVVSCTRFVPYKRVDYLIESIAQCKSSVALIIAGNGPLEPEIKQYAKLYKYPIHFLSAVSHCEAVNLIAAADVYVQASTDYKKAVLGGNYIHTEGMGRSLIEAICCGVPVVVTECGAVGEYINKHNGALVNDKDAFASAVDYFLENNILYPNNVFEFTERYSFDTIFKRYESLWK